MTLRLLLIIIWLLLGLVYWYAASCCCQNEIDTSLVIVNEPCQEIFPLYSKWSDQAVYSSKMDWSYLRDSLENGLKPNEKILITGLYSEREDKRTSEKDLGIARAINLIEQMGMDTTLVQSASRKLRNNKWKDSTCSFKAIEIKYVISTDKIKEIADRTIIYFPYNSTRKLNDNEVEEYLDGVISKFQQEDRIEIIGHTDAQGTPESNLLLGIARANVIRDYLLSKGIKANRIITDTKGHTNPIGDNDTQEGRAQNRRTELRILKADNQ